MKDNRKSNSIRRTVSTLSILTKETDEEHYISTPDLMNQMKTKYGLTADRVTVTHDLQELADFGVPIYKEKRVNTNYYALCERVFDLPELKLLIDCVCETKVLPVDKSRELINKLTTLTCRHCVPLLTEGLYLDERAKPDNSHVYYIIQAILEAMISNQKLSFTYFEYNDRKEHVLRNDGEPYIVSPYSLDSKDGYYYLVGFTDKRRKIQHFRVDRIERAPEILSEPAVPRPENYNEAIRQKIIFHMYDDGERACVVLRCRGPRMNQILDQFGLDVETKPMNNGTGDFIARVNVSASPTFYRWIFGFGGDIQILAPVAVKEEYRDMVRRTAKLCDDSFASANMDSTAFLQ